MGIGGKCPKVAELFRLLKYNDLPGVILDRMGCMGDITRNMMWGDLLVPTVTDMLLQPFDLGDVCQAWWINQES